MHTVSSAFLDALRHPHAAVSVVEAWRGGKRVASNLPVEGGEVTVDAGSKVRRSLSVTLAAEPGLWDKLSPVGTELAVHRGIRFPNGQVELIPLGVFVIDVQKMGYAPNGRLALTAPDRWVRVQRARFERPSASVRGARTRDEMSRLVGAAVPGVPRTATATSRTRLPPVVWERDRDKAVEDMGRSIGAEALFDGHGHAVIRDVSTLAQPSKWLVDASATGVLLGADRERNRQRTYNVVVVSSERTDGRPPFPPQVVADTDRKSPTYVGGPFGRVPYFYTSPLLTTAEQAQAAGRSILDRVRGLAAQLTLESVVNPSLDAGDVLDVLLPPERRGLARPVERHIIDRLTVPLTPDGSQTILTRSSRPDDDEGV